MPREHVAMHDLAPLATYPAGTTFAQRIDNLRREKTAVAIYVVQRFLGPGQQVFISDGSSTFYVGLELFFQAHENVKILTNSLPIAHEFTMWPRGANESNGGLFVPAGRINRQLLMIGGESADRHAQKASVKMGFVVLSVRNLFHDKGPTGEESDSLHIKQAALQAPKATIIIVADHQKLSGEFGDKMPRVFTDDKQWVAVAAKNLYVVSTCRPDIVYPEDTLKCPPVRPSTDKERYLANRWRLENLLGDRFIEIDVAPAPPLVRRQIPPAESLRPRVGAGV